MANRQPTNGGFPSPGVAEIERKEAAEREAYERLPQREDEYLPWEAEAIWPDDGLEWPSES